MQNLSLLFEVCLQQDLVSLLLGLAKYDGTSVPSSVEVDDIGDN